MKKNKVGLLIGRFQPFHKGHLHLLKRALHYADKLIIGLGSANRTDANNPLTFDVRLKMLEKVLRREKVEKRIIKIVGINDYLESDEMWLKKALEQVGEFDVVIGNDEWTDGIFEKAGYTVLRPGFFRRDLYEGIKIRKLMQKGKVWETRVPRYIATTISKLTE